MDYSLEISPLYMLITRDSFELTFFSYKMHLCHRRDSHNNMSDNNLTMDLQSLEHRTL